MQRSQFWPARPQTYVNVLRRITRDEALNPGTHTAPRVVVVGVGGRVGEEGVADFATSAALAAKGY